MLENCHVPIAAGVAANIVLSVYPTQLMEVILGFVMFVILWRLRAHRRAEGWLFGVWCVLAGLERFIVEFFRAKDDRFAWGFGFSTAQFMALGIAVIGLAVMMMRARANPPTALRA